MSKPKILVARAVFPEVIARLEQHFEVESNQSDEEWSPAQLIEHLRGKSGAFTTGGNRIDAQVIAACPELKICANMAVGYNNFDIDAMTAAGVLARTKSEKRAWRVPSRPQTMRNATSPAIV